VEVRADSHQPVQRGVFLPLRMRWATNPLSSVQFKGTSSRNYDLLLTLFAWGWQWENTGISAHVTLTIFNIFAARSCSLIEPSPKVLRSMACNQRFVCIGQRDSFSEWSAYSPLFASVMETAHWPWKFCSKSTIHSLLSGTAPLSSNASSCSLLF
jgi:hypothetical protein